MPGRAGRTDHVALEEDGFFNMMNTNHRVKHRNFYIDSP